MARTTFGASGPTIPDNSTLEYICFTSAVTRAMTTVSSYRGKGNPSVTKYIEGGHTCFYNINYESVRKTGSGDKIPNPFPKDLVKYKKDIEPIFQFYDKHKNKDRIIMVCENEPTTKGFHSGPMSDYLKILEVFVALAKQYGYKVTDGAVHVDRVNSIKALTAKEENVEDLLDNEVAANLNDWDYDIPEPFRIPKTDMYLTSFSSIEEYRGSSSEVSELLKGYKNLDLTAVNLHTANIGGDFDSSKIKKCTDKVKLFTGHESWSNEWHVENTNNQELLTKIATGWAQAGVEFTVYLTGTPGGDCPLNSGKNLTSFGQAYKNFIINWKQGI